MVSKRSVATTVVVEIPPSHVAAAEEDAGMDSVAVEATSEVTATADVVGEEVETVGLLVQLPNPPKLCLPRSQESNM